MQMKARWWVFGGLMVLSAGCSDFLFSSDSDRTMTIEGVVTDYSTGAPMEGVFVSLEWTLPDTSSSSIFQHIDTNTSETGTYVLETKLGEVSCHTLQLFIGTPGYAATRRFPACKGGKQTFNVVLRSE